MRRYPYHRYLAYQLLNGDAVADVIAHMRELEYIPPLPEDVDELAGHVRRQRAYKDARARYQVEFFDAKTPSADEMRWLVETPRARTCIERLLLDRVYPEYVATIASLKFGRKMTMQAVEFFRDGFWDTSLLTTVDFAEYFRLGAQTKPEPPPEAVSLATRPQYAAWKQGLQPSDEELSPEVMVREIQVDAFMRFKELSSRADFDTAKRWAELVLKTAPARRAISEAKIGSRPDLLAVKPVLDYGPCPQHTPSLGELHAQYAQETSGTGAASEAAGGSETGTKKQA